MTKPPNCVSCQFYRPANIPGKETYYAKCGREIPSLVGDFQPASIISFCSGQRKNGWLWTRLLAMNLCGKEGRFWTPKTDAP